MLYWLISILGIILTIFLVVGVHEFGHFLIARLVGVKVLRFSIGFGKALFRLHDKKGTEYVIAAIPLGGYVKMVDETEEEVAKKDLPFAYNRQPFWKKLAIVAAGPFFNLLFAFLIYCSLFLIGFIGIVPIIGQIKPDSIAAEAHVKPNQEIIRINDEKTPTWTSIIVSLLQNVGDKTEITLTTKELNSAKNNQYQLNLAHWKVDNLKPDPLDSLGIVPYEPKIPAMVGKISRHSTAQNLLKTNDKILAVNNQKIIDWYDLQEIIDKNPLKKLDFKILRDKKIMVIPIPVGSQRDLLFHQHGYIGFSPQFEWPKMLLRAQKYNLSGSISHAWYEIKIFTYLNFLVIGKLLTGKISFSSLGGPITIFESAGVALNHGFVQFFSFIAFLSISIGLINILPIPGLDGGHILFQLIEVIIRRPVPLRFQILFYRLGFIFLLLLITQALINDLQRL